MRLTPILLFLLLLLASSVPGQNINMAHPEEVRAQRPVTPDDIRERVNNRQFQQDTKELGDLCASLPADLDHLRQGTLSKDLLDKLKRVEKLSKRVREELTRSPRVQ